MENAIIEILTSKFSQVIFCSDIVQFTSRFVCKKPQFQRKKKNASKKNGQSYSSVYRKNASLTISLTEKKTSHAITKMDKMLVILIH